MGRRSPSTCRIPCARPWAPWRATRPPGPLASGQPPARPSRHPSSDVAHPPSMGEGLPGKSKIRPALCQTAIRLQKARGGVPCFTSNRSGRWAEIRAGRNTHALRNPPHWCLKSAQAIGSAGLAGAHRGAAPDRTAACDRGRGHPGPDRRVDGRLHARAPGGRCRPGLGRDPGASRQGCDPRDPTGGRASRGMPP